MEHAIALEPKVALSHWYFVTMLMDVDRPRAAQELTTALQLGYELQGPQEIHVAALIFANVGNFTEAVRYEKMLIDQGYITNPLDPILVEFDTFAKNAKDTAARQWLRDKFSTASLPPIQ